MSDLRRLVLDTSADLVAADGVASLSMREVARRAGVSHQAPYHHFKDREGILAALVQEGFATLADAVEATATEPDPAERLAAAGVAYVRFARTHPGHFRVMFRPDLVPLGRWPDADAQAARAHGALERAVTACVAAGLARPEDADELLAGAWALVHGLAVLVLDGPLAPARPDATAGSPRPGLDVERVARLFARLLAERAPNGSTERAPNAPTTGRQPKPRADKARR